MTDIAVLKKEIIRQVDKIAPEAIELSHYIHANPEIGGEEFKASARIAAELERYGFSVEKATGMVMNFQ